MLIILRQSGGSKYVQVGGFMNRIPQHYNHTSRKEGGGGIAWQSEIKGGTFSREKETENWSNQGTKWKEIVG